MQRLKYIWVVIFVVILGLLDAGKQVFTWFELKQKILSVQSSLAQLSAKPAGQKTIIFVDKEKLLDSFVLAAENSGLTSQLITVAPDVEYWVKIDASISGTFLQLIQFFNKLAQECFPFYLQSSEMSAAEHGQLRIHLKMMMQTSCLQEMQNTNFLQFSQTENWNDPFASTIISYGDNDTPQNQSKLLHSYSIKQLKVVGYLRVAQQYHAIIKLPDGESLLIKAGDKLGREQVQVMQIHENKLLLK